MDWNNGNWTSILNALRRGRGVVPVIGPALQLVPGPDGVPTPFVSLLARHIRENLPERELALLPPEPGLHALALAPSFAFAKTYKTQKTCVKHHMVWKDGKCHKA